KDHLRDALIEHLAKNGFSTAEIADLVVDDVGALSKGRNSARARIRQRRQFSEGARTVRPWPPEPPPAKEIPAGFRSLAKGSAQRDNRRDERSRPCPVNTSSLEKSPKKRGPR